MDFTSSVLVVPGLFVYEQNGVVVEERKSRWALEAWLFYYLLLTEGMPFRSSLFFFAGRLPWWQRWDTMTLIIVIASVLLLLVAVIIICIVIICICRKRRRQDKCEYPLWRRSRSDPIRVFSSFISYSLRVIGHRMITLCR